MPTAKHGPVEVSEKWSGRSLVTLMDVSRVQIEQVIRLAADLKQIHRTKTPVKRWDYPRTLGMLFEKPSLRTRVSFEAGMAQMGGHAIYLASADVGLGTRESIADVAGALSRWVDIISARVFKHETVVELAEHSAVPVINALSDREHPIQAFADLMTLLEHKPIPPGQLKLAYVGDGNNVLHALLLACAKMGISISAACPEGYFPDEEYVRAAQQIGLNETEAVVKLVTDPVEAVQNADAVYTDVWASMGQEAEQAHRAEIFKTNQLNSRLLQSAKSDAIAMHCLPAHRGEEISAEIMLSHATTILDQAENRLHTQKALISLMLGF